jgi:NADPH2:quinone reductase
VLVHGGTSGVGSLAIQILRALGHEVYATCGTNAKCELALSLGATAAFNYRTHSFPQEIARCTGGRGVDVILDLAGARYGRENVEALARRGRLVHLSPGDGADFVAPLRAIMAKEARITGSLLRPLPMQEKTAIAEALRRVVLPLVESGRVRPVIHRVFPLAAAADAHAALESGDVAGKLLLDCRAR